MSDDELTLHYIGAFSLYISHLLISIYADNCDFLQAFFSKLTVYMHTSAQRNGGLDDDYQCTYSHALPG